MDQASRSHEVEIHSKGQAQVSPLLKHNMHRFIKQWNEIEKAQTDLDFRRSQWARDVLQACGSERAFKTWCQSELNLTDHKINQLIARAATIKVVSDSATWNQLGGFAKLDKVATLPKREAVAVIEAAKSQCLSVRTVMKQRGHIAPPPPIQPVPVSSAKRGAMRDAQDLARYLDSLRKQGTVKLPSDIATIVDMYR